MTEIRITEEPPDGPDGRVLLAAQERELRERYDGIDGPAVTPTPGDRLTVFLVTRDAATGEAVGCGALHAHTPEIVEIKRMYVTPAARRRRLGLEILTALEREAALRSFVTVRLELGDRQPEAEALYRQAGYRPVAPWGAYATDARARCFERDITPSPAD